MKPNCYECVYRHDLPFDAHSACQHPAIHGRNARIGLLTMAGMTDNPLGVKGNAHGIRNGWFMWPLNFDPIWLDACNGFQRKEDTNAQGNGNPVSESDEKRVPKREESGCTLKPPRQASRSQD